MKVLLYKTSSWIQNYFILNQQLQNGEQHNKELESRAWAFCSHLFIVILIFFIKPFLIVIIYIKLCIMTITKHQLTRRTLIFSLKTVSINNFTKFNFKYFQSPSSSLMLRAPLMMRSDEQYQLPWTKFILSNTRSITTCVHALQNKSTRRSQQQYLL